MRTTLDIDDDVLLVAKELAAQKRISIGKALSELARHALNHPAETALRNGLPLFPVQPAAGRVTLELVNQLRQQVPQPAIGSGPNPPADTVDHVSAGDT